MLLDKAIASRRSADVPGRDLWGLSESVDPSPHRRVDRLSRGAERQRQTGQSRRPGYTAHPQTYRLQMLYAGWFRPAYGHPTPEAVPDECPLNP